MQLINTLKTRYASAERLSPQEIAIQHDSFQNLGHLKSILDATSIVFFIVNEQRQIVFSNNHFLEKMNIDSIEKILGLRPGESMGCVNATNAYSGCGTSKACRSCGMVGAIIEALDYDKRVVKETTVILNDEKRTQLQLEVTASPFLHAGQRYIYFSAIDIEQKKRKEMMENIFFHDVLNLMMSLEGYLDMMEEMGDEEKKRYFPKVKHISNQLLEEIVAQQDLLKAENGKLEVQPKVLKSRLLLEDVRIKLLYVKSAVNKTIILDDLCEDCSVETDQTLLSRVLVNMLKNALEASVSGSDVVLRCKCVKGNILFSVTNNGEIPEFLKPQIFQRSVSTKGNGRGLGTYSMKLLGESYLRGKVWFESALNETTFFISLPIQFKA